MRHPREGTPFVPPNPICPTRQRGSLSDLAGIPFEFFVDVYNGITFSSAVFGDVNPTNDDFDTDTSFVEISSLTVSSDAELARQLHMVTRLKGVDGESAIVSSCENPIVEQIRLAFCDRVMNCQGIVDGQCWALGAQAAKEVVQTVVNDLEQ